MISFFTRKHTAPPLPLPPLDPPPSAEKRHEKEKAWLQTVKSSTGRATGSRLAKSSSDGVQIIPPRGIEHIAVKRNDAHEHEDESGRRLLSVRGWRTGHSRNKSDSEHERTSLSLARAALRPSSTKSGVSSSNQVQQGSPSRALPVTSSSARPPLSAPSSHTSFVHVAPPPLTSPSALAKRLAELEAAHKSGLLDEAEYRILRQNLFERAQETSSGHGGLESSAGLGVQPEPPTERDYEEQVRRRAEASSVERTGKLLALPRLQPSVRLDERKQEATGAIVVEELTALVSLDTIHLPFTFSPGFIALQTEPVALQSEHLHPENNNSLQPSSSSSRTTSGRLSFRSSKTTASSASRLVGSLFRRHASTPAPESSSAAQEYRAEVHDNADDAGSILSRAMTIRSGKSSKKSRQIPRDWRELNNEHRRLDSGEKTMRKDNPRDRTLSTSRSDPMLIITARKGSISKKKEASEDMPPLPIPANSTLEESGGPTSSLPTRRPSLLKRYRSDSKLTVKSHESHSAALSPTRASFSNGQSSLISSFDDSFTPHQAGDETLNSKELSRTIQALKEEKLRLLAQYGDLESSLIQKHGLESEGDLSMRRSIAGRARSGSDLNGATSAGLGRRGSQQPNLQRQVGRMSVSQSPASSPPSSVGLSLGGQEMGRRPSVASSASSGSNGLDALSLAKHASISRANGTKHSSATSASSAGGKDALRSSQRPLSTGARSDNYQEELSMPLPPIPDYSPLALTLAADPLDLALSAVGAGGAQVVSSAPVDPGMKELDDLRGRKALLEKRYAARLEYLEARLVGELRKEKLRK